MQQLQAQNNKPQQQLEKEKARTKRAKEDAAAAKGKRAGETWEGCSLSDLLEFHLIVMPQCLHVLLDRSHLSELNSVPVCNLPVKILALVRVANSWRMYAANAGGPMASVFFNATAAFWHRRSRLALDAFYRTQYSGVAADDPKLGALGFDHWPFIRCPASAGSFLGTS